MMGKELEDISELQNQKASHAKTDDELPFLEAFGLSSCEGTKPFDFKISKGEVNGFTGLLGSGHKRKRACIFAADKITGGTIRVNGKDVKIKSPRTP